MRPSLCGGNEFRDITSNICYELKVNLDDTFYCRNMIKRSQAFQLNFANVMVITGMDKMVHSIDSNFSDIKLCH